MHASVDVHPTFITTSDGLANNSVRYLFQDSKGFIWMGTLDGLSRYDGHSFVTFRPESGDKISLANHHVKKKWFLMVYHCSGINELLRFET